MSHEPVPPPQTPLTDNQGRIRFPWLRWFQRKLVASEIEDLAPSELILPSFADSDRPAAGTAGRVIFNTDDGNLNIDDGTNWILPDGTTT